MKVARTVRRGARRKGRKDLARSLPYQHALETEAGKRNMHLYLAGLLSHLDRKNAEEIAALVDVERLVLQAFIGTAPWDHCPLLTVGRVPAPCG